MIVTTYKAKNGARFNDKEAQKIGKSLEKLGSQFAADDVVRVARKPTSALHKHFEWDDTKAATEYRLEQARCLVRSVEVIITTAKGQQHTRAFHCIEMEDSDTGKSCGMYVPVSIVKERPEMRDQVLQRAMTEIRGWRHRYDQYEDVFGEVFAGIDAAESRVSGMEPNLSRAAG